MYSDHQANGRRPSSGSTSLRQAPRFHDPCLWVVWHTPLRAPTACTRILIYCNHLTINT